MRGVGCCFATVGAANSLSTKLYVSVGDLHKMVGRNMEVCDVYCHTWIIDVVAEVDTKTSKSPTTR